MTTENTNAVENTNAINTVTATQQEAKMNPMQTEIERRLAAAKARIEAEVRQEQFTPRAKKLLKANPLMEDFMEAVKDEDAEFVTFLFSNARVSFVGLDSEAPKARGNGSSTSNLTNEQVIAALQATQEPTTIGNLAKLLDATTEDVRPFLKYGVAKGSIVQSGEKRATAYALSAEVAAPSPEAEAAPAPESAPEAAPAPEAEAAPAPEVEAAPAHVEAQ